MLQDMVHNYHWTLNVYTYPCTVHNHGDKYDDEYDDDNDGGGGGEDEDGDNKIQKKNVLFSSPQVILQKSPYRKPNFFMGTRTGES